MVTLSEETVYLKMVSSGQELSGKFQGPYGLQKPHMSVFSLQLSLYAVEGTVVHLFYLPFLVVQMWLK